jgi:hypothetical protein
MMRGREILTEMAIAELRGQIEHFCGLGDRVIDQTRRRVLFGEQVATAEKIYSIFEPHTDLIKRGKVRTPVEFGHKVFLAESAKGLVTQYQVLKGNPPDEVHVASSLQRHRQVFGRVRSCMARIAASSVTKTWHRAGTLVSSWCAFRSGAAREHRGAKRTRAAPHSKLVSVFVPALKDASRCCSEAAA